MLSFQKNTELPHRKVWNSTPLFSWLLFKSLLDFLFFVPFHLLYNALTLSYFFNFASHYNFYFYHILLNSFQYRLPPDLSHTF